MEKLGRRGEGYAPALWIKADKLLLYVSILLGAFLRLYRLGHQSIWGDESLTLLVYTAGDGFIDLVSVIWQRAFHPPLYFLIVNYWYRLGDSEFMLRFPSVVFGIVSIPIMYLVVRRLFGATTAGIAALILALSPFHIWYSQEARMYSLYMLLSLASMLFFVRAWQERRPLDYALYGIFTLLALLTHIAGLLLVAAQGAFVLGIAARNWRRCAVWISVQSMTVLAYTPWIMNFMARNKSGDGVMTIGFERGASLLDLGYSLYSFSVGYSLGPPVSALHYVSPEDAVRSYLFTIAVCVVVFCALIALGMTAARRASHEGFWFVAGHLFVPIVLVTAASILPGVPLNPRYIMVAAIPYYIVLALGVHSCMRKFPLYTIPVATLLLAAISLHNHYFHPIYAKQDMRSAVGLVNKEAQPGDVVIISSVELGGPFIYYFQREGIPYYGYPPRAGLVDPEKLPEDMKRMLEGKRRAWLILGRTWSSDPEGLIPASLESQFRPVEGGAFFGVDVTCFSLSK